MAGKKYYAVAVGRARGIYTSWPEVHRAVSGFSGAKFKGFTSEAEARLWLENHEPPVRKPARDSAVLPLLPTPAEALIVYTDGGCSGNPGPGGYGVVIDDGAERRELSGGYRLTTNNRMEMTAAIVALQVLQGSTRPILLYSDSAYLVNGINKGWARNWRSRGWRKADGQPALNVDLWQRLLELTGVLKVQFHWVKGHAGHQYNERCDTLAVEALRGLHLAVDHGYEESSAAGCSTRARSLPVGP